MRAMSQASPSHATSSQSFLPPRMDDGKLEAPPFKKLRPLEQKHKPILEHVAPPKLDKSEKPTPEQEPKKPKSNPKSENPVPEQVAPPEPNKSEKPSPEQQFEKPKSTPKSENPVPEQVAPPKPRKDKKFCADEMDLENFPPEARIIFL